MRVHAEFVAAATLVPVAFLGGLGGAASGLTLPVLVRELASLVGVPGGPGAYYPVTVIGFTAVVLGSYVSGRLLGAVGIALAFVGGLTVVVSPAAGLTLGLLAVAFVFLTVVARNTSGLEFHPEVDDPE